MDNRSAGKIISSKIIGFVVFLILLGIANLIMNYFDNQIYQDIILFFNDNLVLLLILAFVGMISELFWIFIFPFNIIAPIISAVYGTFVLKFLLNFLDLINLYLKTGINVTNDWLYWAVFWIVLIVGYLVLFSRIGSKKKEKERIERLENSEREQKKKEEVEWKEVGNEFKQALYKVGKRLNDKLDKKEKKSKRKK